METVPATGAEMLGRTRSLIRLRRTGIFEPFEHRWKAFQNVACLHARANIPMHAVADAPCQPPPKKLRLLNDIRVFRDLTTSPFSYRLELVGDSLLVVHWAWRIWRPTFSSTKTLRRSCIGTWNVWPCRRGWPRACITHHLDSYRHVLRGRNKKC